MIDNGSSADKAHPPSLSEALKTALGALSSAVHTRLELFVVELEEERERVKRTLLLALLAVVGLNFGFILLNIFIVALLLDKGWLVALGCLAFFYLALGSIGVWMLRKKFLTRPRLFPATLTELGKDRDRLRSAAHE